MEPNKIMMLNLLSNQKLTFFIPPYQRNYEWEESQCKILLKDIFDLVQKHRDGKRVEHFFGTIVFVRNPAPFGKPAKLVLTDGQQRITSTMLLLAAIRDLLSDPDGQDIIHNDYLINRDVKESNPDYQIKLKQVERDWPAYRKIILKKDLEQKDQNTAVYRNYKFFKDQLSKMNLTDQQLQELLEAGLGKLSLVTIELDPINNPWENPQEIFESMNSLGKPLSLADLCRNFLLLSKSAEEQDQLYNDYWLEMEELLPGELSNFVRDYMQLKDKDFYAKANESNTKSLYADFKKLFSDSETGALIDAEGLLKDLKRSSKTYSMIVMKANTGNKKVNKLLQDLQALKATNLNPFLMSVIDQWISHNMTDEEIVDVLNVVRNYILRRRILKLTQGENKGLPLLTSEVDELVKSTDKKDFVYKLLGNQNHALRFPNDNEVIDALKNMDFYSFAHKKFLLSLLEENITKSNPYDEKNVQVEHIMPRTLNSEWKEVLGENADEIHDEYVNRLGNLTLIRYNQELGNKSFDDKKKIYQNKEGLVISRQMITDQDKWGPDQIVKRENWIASKIVQDIIPIPDSMKKHSNYTSGSKRLFSFEEAGLVGKTIAFIEDPKITAKVVSNREVEYEGQNWKLSKLTQELKERNGSISASRSYRGANFWQYDGTKLIDL